MKYICVILSVILCAVLQFEIVLSDHDEDTWIEPNAWALERNKDLRAKTDYYGGSGSNLAENKCPACQCDGNAESKENAVALVYFRKYIATLFNRKKMKLDDGNSYRFTVRFTVPAALLDRLDQLSDPRDLDSTLSEIFKGARHLQSNYGFSSKDDMSALALIWDMLKDALQLLRSNEIQFVLFVIVAFIIIWYIHRRYGIKIIYLVIGAVFILGYFHTYIECNKKLQMEEILEVYDQTMPTSTSWFSRLTSFFSSVPDEKQLFMAKLKNDAKVRLPFCRPDHVFLMYANELFMSQTKILFEHCVSTISKLTGDMPFPFSYLAPVFVLVFLGYIIKLTFKYILSPRSWAALIHKPHYAATLAAAEQQAIASNEDRISGANLKLLLSIAASGSIGGAGEPLSVSGVQDIMEAIEAPNSKKASPQKSTPISGTQSEKELLNSSTSPQSISSNNNDKVIENKSKVILEDDCADED